MLFGSSGDDDKQKKIILYTHSVLIQYSKCEEARMNPSFEKKYIFSLVATASLASINIGEEEEEEEGRSLK